MANYKCIIGEPCQVHGFIHGAEAEELRSRFEKLITELPKFIDDFGFMTVDQLEDVPNQIITEIEKILDDVDARDSVAWLEFKNKLEEVEED